MQLTRRLVQGPSMMVMSFRNRTQTPLPSPILFSGDADLVNGENTGIPVGAELLHTIPRQTHDMLPEMMGKATYGYYSERMPKFSRLHMLKGAGDAASSNETSQFSMAFQGTYSVGSHMQTMTGGRSFAGSGHHGVDYVGVASVRAGKGSRYPPRTFEFK